MIRKALLLLAPLALAVSAHAQFAAYGTFTATSLGGIQGSPAAIQPPTTSPLYPIIYRTSVDPIGGTGGIFYDFKTFGPVRLGVDLRGSILTQKQGAELGSQGAGIRIDSGLAGVRLSFHPRYQWMKPYLQGSAGIGRTNYGTLGPGSPNTTGAGLVNNFEYHVYGGVDIKVFSVMDFRLAEFGYGGLDPFGTNAHNYPLRSVSSGVVFHFPVN